MEDFFGSTVDDLKKANLVTIGLLLDKYSSFRKGSSRAPDVIRKATSAKLYNPFNESLINVKEKWRVYDAGNLQLNNLKPDEIKKIVTTAIESIYRINNSVKYVFLGGDHISTFFSMYGLFKAGVLNKDDSIGMIYLDAHPDLYYELENNPYSHACVVRRIIDEITFDPKMITQIGVRAPTIDQVSFAEDAGIEIITRKEFQTYGPIKIGEKLRTKYEGKVNSIYLSIDLDVLDPAFAPGLGNPEPGGLSTAELVDLVQEFSPLPIFALDIVELNPEFDISNISAFVIAKLIREILGIM